MSRASAALSYERRKPLRVLAQAAVNELKDNPCVDCGGRFPSVVMDFDHRDPSTKEMAIANMVNHSREVDDILVEIAKCDLVCSNCHRMRTYGVSYPKLQLVGA